MPSKLSWHGGQPHGRQAVTRWGRELKRKHENTQNARESIVMLWPASEMERQSWL